MNAPDMLAGAMADNVVAFPPKRDETREILEISVEILNREIEKGERVLGFLLISAEGDHHADVQSWLRHVTPSVSEEITRLIAMRDAELDDLSGMQRSRP